MTKQILAIAAVFVVIVAVGLAALLLYSASDSDGELATLEESVLQLGDLPRGYTIGDDSGCGLLTPEGRPPDLAAVLGRTLPDACRNQLERFDGVQPAVIESVAIELETAAAAVRTMAVVPALGRYVVGSPVDAAAEPYDFGDQAALTEYVDGNGAPWLLLTWRAGSRIYIIGQQGSPAPDPLTSILALAKRQQKRAGDPRPLTAADLDDRAVALDRPDLGVPVYWLGERFEPKGALPELALARSFGPWEPAGAGPGNRVQIDYDPPITLTPSSARLVPATGIELTVWQRARWETFLQSELGDLGTSQPCSEPQVIQLQDRRIEIHSPQPVPPPNIPNLGERSSERRDRTLPPDENGSNLCPPNFVAHVYFDDAVVAINFPLGFGYTGPGGEYNSAAGIEAVARGLMKR